MQSLLAIDPGKHRHACALFLDGVFTNAWFQVRSLIVMTAHAERVVAELPQVYQRGKSKGNPNDLIDLALALGRFTGGVTCEYVLPAQWKGQIPKTIHHQRMRAALWPTELIALDESTSGELKTQIHNLYDSVCLGLTVLGRLTPGPIRGRIVSRE